MTSDSQKSSPRPRQNNDGAVPDWVLQLWERSGGKSWEPPDPQNKHVIWLIDNGFVRRVDGRCGFEAFKDSMLTWTIAAKAVFQRASGVKQ